MKSAIAILFIVMLAGSLVVSVQFVSLTQANFFPDPGPDLPRIYIKSDGSVEPTTAPIEKTGSFYKLTDNIILYTIEIQRGNIALDGSDYYIRGNESWMGTAPRAKDAGNNGIIITDQTNITITHLNIEKFTTGVRIFNSSNINILSNRFIDETANMDSATGIAVQDSSFVLVENNNFSSIAGSAIVCNGTNNIIRNNTIMNGAACIDGSIALEGSSNLILDNIIEDMLPITLDRANSNIISRNKIFGPTSYSQDQNRTGSEGIALYSRCSNNLIVGNIITGFNGQAIRTVFSCSNNTFYANYFANNGFAVALQDGAINNTFYGNNFAADSCKVQIDDGVKGTLWDNGAIGNYWGDYNGTDNNDDGIGDTPYIINAYKWDIKAEGFVSYISGQDNHPLMIYYNIDDNTTPEPSPSIPEFPAWITIPIATITVLIIIFLKRKKQTKNTASFLNKIVD